MGFVPKFKHDIFISYASGNNPITNDNSKGWVTKSQERLLMFLKAKLGRELDIWFDEKNIVTGDLFETKIRDGLEKSATILVFLSGAYLRSPWCTMERDLFLKCLVDYSEKGRAGISGNERIFIARLEQHIEHEIPDVLTGVHSKAFFRQDSGSGAPLCWPELLASSEDQDYILYGKILNELGNDISKKLKQLKDRIESDEVKYYRGSASTSDNRTFYQDRLKDCDGLVIIYGEAEESWVTLHLQNSYTVLERGLRKRPYAAGAIIIPPPEIEREMLSYEPSYMEKINCTRGFDPEVMKAFCDSVKDAYEEDKKKNPNRYPAPLVFVHALDGTDREFAANIKIMGKKVGVECIIPKERKISKTLREA